MDSLEFIRKILEHSGRGMALLDHLGVVRAANPLFFSATGLDAGEVESLPLEKRCADPSGPADIRAILDRLRPEDAWQGNWVFRPSRGEKQGGEHGEERLLNVRLLGLGQGLEQGQEKLFLLCLEGGGEAAAGTVDPLTGLPAAEIFLDRVEQFIRFSRREAASAIILLIRPDRFSLVTDGLGRQQGDEILREMARRLRQGVRESDTVALVDRETFGLLLRVTKETHASLVAEKVLENIARPVTVGGQTMVVTASIGIVSCRNADRSGRGLMACAETAMHHAAAMGGNVYHFFADELNEKARQRVEMENSLRGAVENEEFQLFYQPKVDIDTSRIVGAEALIRWMHPERGMVPPFHFIPVAEETGLIIDIGRWVLVRACRQILAWQGAGLTPVPVAVNVSPRQFQHPGFYGDVGGALEETGLDPSLLELEITESMLMSDVDQVVEKLSKLSGVGLNLAIDDFGTGYSNLSYLVRFPVSTLKIDRTFIKDLEKDSSMAGLTHSIIAMSKNLNLKIVAEGAENEAHIRFLKDHGCSVVQGYYYSKPVPADTFAQMLKRGKIMVPS